MKDRAKFTIDVVQLDGRPLEPKKAANKFIRQAGVLVRDHIPITIEEWNKPKKGDATFVEDRSKLTLWTNLLKNFNLPPEEDENNPVIKEKVKEWTYKKMATIFRNWKTQLNKFVKANETPNWEDAQYAKIRPHWAEFVAIKKGPKAAKRSETNRLNATKKEYHQRVGSGGYASQRPKWERAEQELRDRGIPIQTEGWDLRAKTWFYGIGAKLDLETGLCIFPKDILAKPVNELIKAYEETAAGTFHPDREKDQLARAIGKPEHPGLARGTGGMTWKDGFAEHHDSYRWRGRKEKERTDRMTQIEETLVPYNFS